MTQVTEQQRSAITQAVAEAENRLLAQMSAAPGGWSKHPGGPRDVRTTALALRALSARAAYGATEVVQAGLSWLQDQLLATDANPLDAAARSALEHLRKSTDLPPTLEMYLQLHLEDDEPQSALTTAADDHPVVRLEAAITDDTPTADRWSLALDLYRARLSSGGWGQPSEAGHYADLIDNQLTARAVVALQWLLTEPSGTPSSEQQASLVAAIYADPVLVPIDEIAPAGPVDHTMSAAIDAYARQKIPAAHIEALLAHGGRIEVHGVYPTHLAQLLTLRGYSGLEPAGQMENERAMSTVKRFNSIRPFFMTGRDPSGQPVMVAGVGVGRDYAMHYASMLRYASMTASLQRGSDVTVVHYPRAEAEIAAWTHLDDFVEPGDRVLLGYVAECAEGLGFEAEPMGCEDPWRTNDWYGSRRVELPDGSTLNFLGVRYSFWGNLSERLVEALCRRGVSEVVYVAKLGALTSDEDLYRRIFLPVEFAVLRGDRIEEIVESPPNGIATADRVAIDPTGLHVSIPTVLEEDYNQRALATSLGAQSIDNEIAKMAAAISRHNDNAETPIKFSAAHFATDYVRAEHERLRGTSHDLATTRTDAARRAKDAILGEIIDRVLRPYFGLGPPAARSEPLRVGMIGAGVHASEALLPALSISDQFTLNTVCTSKVESAETARLRWGFASATDDLAEAFDEVDAVVVSGLPALHEAALRVAIDQRVPIFVEKPAGLDEAMLAELAEAAGDLTVFVDFNMRFATQYDHALRVARQQGTIRALEFRLVTSKPHEPMWGLPSTLAAFLHGFAIHAIEAPIALFGAPTQVQALFVRRDATRFGIDAHLTFEDRAVARLHLGNYSNRFETHTEFVTNAGSVTVTGLDEITLMTHAPDTLGSKALHTLTLSPLVGGFARNGYQRALESFARSVRTGEPSWSPLENSVIVARVIADLLAQLET